MEQYQIHYFRKDGSTALVYNASCNNDLDAGAAAQSMMNPDIARVEIWRGDRHVSAIKLAS